MKLTRAELTDFGAFERVRIDACPGINVFLGANGTGKSQAMKAMYALAKVGEETAPILSFDIRIREKLGRSFRTDKFSLSRLIRRSFRGDAAEREAKVFLESTSGNIEVKIISDPEAMPGVKSASWGVFQSVMFLPTGDLLGMSEGFGESYRKRELAFDETYFDAVSALYLSQLRGEELNGIRELVTPLEAIIGGPVKLEGQRFYVHRKDGAMEASLLAEGHRKLAVLARLILNGSLTANSILFWDEPETNLNPRLSKAVVEVLVGLAQRGVQIFVTTHDYLLSQKLSLLAEYEQHPDVPMRFFAFYREDGDDDKPVNIEAGDTLADLPDNPILEQFAEHYDYKRELFIDAAEKRRE